MIFNKNIVFFQNKLTESVGKPKDLLKALKSLGLPNKVKSIIQLNATLTQY